MQIGTFAIAAATLGVGVFTGWNSVRLNQLQQQLAAFQTRSQVTWRYVVLSPQDGCPTVDGGGSLAVMQNDVASSYSTIACMDGAPTGVLLAGIVVEDPDTGSSLFAPRVTVDLIQTSATPGTGIWDVSVPGESLAKPTQLGFVEEGAKTAPFIPLAVLDADGGLLSQTVIRPLRLRWTSPVTQEEVTIDLGWFRPRDEWLADGALLFAQ